MNPSAHAAIVQIARRAGIDVRAEPAVPPLDDSEWQIVVMGATLIEAAIDDILRSAISPVEAGLFVARNRFSDKLTLAVRLGLISEHLRNGAREIVELRNSIVHDLSLFSFQFQAHFSKHPSDRERFDSAVSPCMADIGLEAKPSAVDRRQQVFAVAYLVIQAAATRRPAGIS